MPVFCEQHILLCGSLENRYVVTLADYFNSKAVEPLRDDPSLLPAFVKNNTVAWIARHDARDPLVVSDSPEGLPAYQKFDARTGYLILKERRQDGLLHDLFPGLPALSVFNPKTGKLVRTQSFAKGVPSNGQNGFPSLLHFDARGRLIDAERSFDGEGEKVREKEFSAFERQAYDLWSLPCDSTKPFSAPRR